MSLFSHRIRIHSDQPPHPGACWATRWLVERWGSGGGARNVSDASLQSG
jgi:hypothetical protein